MISNLKQGMTELRQSVRNTRSCARMLLTATILTAIIVALLRWMKGPVKLSTSQAVTYLSFSSASSSSYGQLFMRRFGSSQEEQNDNDNGDDEDDNGSGSCNKHCYSDHGYMDDNNKNQCYNDEEEDDDDDIATDPYSQFEMHAQNESKQIKTMSTSRQWMRIERPPVPFFWMPCKCGELECSDTSLFANLRYDEQELWDFMIRRLPGPSIVQKRVSMIVISTNAMHTENGWTATLFMLLSAILLDLHHHEHHGKVVVLVPRQAFWARMLTSSLEHNHAMMVASSHVHLLKSKYCQQGWMDYTINNSHHYDQNYEDYIKPPFGLPLNAWMRRLLLHPSAVDISDQRLPQRIEMLLLLYENGHTANSNAHMPLSPFHDHHDNDDDDDANRMKFKSKAKWHDCTLAGLNMKELSHMLCEFVVEHVVLKSVAHFDSPTSCYAIRSTLVHLHEMGYTLSGLRAGSAAFDPAYSPSPLGSVLAQLTNYNERKRHPSCNFLSQKQRGSPLVQNTQEETGLLS